MRVRIILAAAAALAMPAAARDMGPRDVDKLPASPPALVEAYGADTLERGELRLPAGKGPFPVAIVIHGGCWTKGFATLRNTAPLATALSERGIATWNIEYRQVGDPGAGWPGTFQDWGAAADHLRALAKRYPLDLNRVVAVGHSAGAHAAIWLALRPKLPAASPVRGRTPLRLAAAVAIDGPPDVGPFVGLDAEICGKPVIVPLVGGTPAEHPERYRQTDASALLPLGIPQYLVASAVLPADAAERYRAAAVAKGDRVTVLAPQPGGDHFNIIAPGEPQGDAITAFIMKAFGR